MLEKFGYISFFSVLGRRLNFTNKLHLIFLLLALVGGFFTLLELCLIYKINFILSLLVVLDLRVLSV